MHPSPTVSRRSLTRLAATLPAPLAFAVLGGRQAGIALAQDGSSESATPPALAPTPTCVDDDDLELTEGQTEGPYFTPGSPERSSLLEPDMPGTRLTISGYVYSADCVPVARALLDTWQANGAGEYDNVAYTLRGHQFTDDEGRFNLETIVPGLYPGRTRHIHVMVQAPNGPVLTSQLYFPDEPENEGDGIFDPQLVMDVTDVEDGKQAFFTIVVETG